ncbi:MAG: orotate phosphoribosyltransferase [Candidatus Roizmanbacteria bacterium]
MDKIADILLQIGAVSFRFDPPYTYTSGMLSPIYVDNRLIISYPKERTAIIDGYVDIITKTIGIDSFDYISATATAAIPQGAWIADRLNKPMVFVRSAKKGHGKGNQIEGFLKKNSRVVIIEDHLSTAKSCIENAQAIREAGCTVSFVVATTTYNTDLAKKAFRENNLTPLVLTTITDILNIAVSKKIIQNYEQIEVENWLRNPSEWGKKL